MIEIDRQDGVITLMGPDVYVERNGSALTSLFELTVVRPGVQVTTGGDRVRGVLVTTDLRRIATTRWRDCEEDFFFDVDTMLRGLIGEDGNAQLKDRNNLKNAMYWLQTELAMTGKCKGVRLEPEFLTDEEADADAERPSWTLGSWNE